MLITQLFPQDLTVVSRVPRPSLRTVVSAVGPTLRNHRARANYGLVSRKLTAGGEGVGRFADGSGATVGWGGGWRSRGEGPDMQSSSSTI
ncbi:unnamed protein product [Periconia digitata]|uniref:Uncharacterized protein n=1 Tax=Periconia digitata TaxID=1303443 RepID=A0A9W4XKZ6_9PLEO|nr:unnamed protein product [Periconia digitata]